MVTGHMRAAMRNKLFRLTSMSWITAMVTGLLLAVVSPAGLASADPGGWDPTLPAQISAGAPGDPLAMANASLQATAQATQTTLDLGKQFLGGLGINLGGTSTGAPSAGAPGSVIPRANGRQAIEYVIKRMGAQMGVPYSWGGGTLQGPGKGIDDGANITGFDCSGLVLYSFAGVGIKLPHYSGSQYNLGRKIPASQMRRGDVIFYGPGGSQHVTIYLGQGQMLEAPDIGLKVRVAPVRTGGMTPYVVRYIEY